MTAVILCYRIEVIKIYDSSGLKLFITLTDDYLNGMVEIYKMILCPRESFIGNVQSGKEFFDVRETTVAVKSFSHLFKNKRMITGINF